MSHMESIRLSLTPQTRRVQANDFVLKFLVTPGLQKVGEKRLQKGDFSFFLKTWMGFDLCLNMMSLTCPSEILMKGKCGSYCVMLGRKSGQGMGKKVT